MSLTVQYIVIAAIGLFCLAFVVRSQLPSTWRKMTGSIALWAVRDGRPAWLKALGRRIAPSARAGNACGGCSNDDNCH
ncbi:hypothetical protein G7069_09610 [Lysobacter sp. HDW10]|jgi:hypothetical protein|uniref:DUF6587 family protein n=1 Tax=Lysobacter sp. HDW10 TaxID=2714936 RepID=UPI00140875C6|nr:DUF6587 family protein [Lysobacter sp. HDW10]QIK81829.1 hypothetical protein G7069_09610 [Lysobacter sp. HDW10]